MTTEIIEKFEIPYKLFTEFNNVKFVDKTHQYVVNFKKQTSVTTFLHKFQHEFEEDRISLEKAEELGMTQADLLADWKFKNKKSIAKGKAVHNYIENLFLNKIYEYPEKEIIDEFGYDPVKAEFDIIRVLIDDFYQKTKGKLIPIKLEFIVYDEEIGIAGMMDGLFFNLKVKEFQIWDWKSNKKIRKKNHFQAMKSPLSHLDDCEMTLYSLQVNLYKYILRRRLPELKIGDCFIVWFNEKNSEAEIIKAYDYMHYIEMLF